MTFKEMTTDALLETEFQMLVTDDEDRITASVLIDGGRMLENILNIWGNFTVKHYYVADNTLTFVLEA